MSESGDHELARDGAANGNGDMDNGSEKGRGRSLSPDPRDRGRSRSPEQRSGRGRSRSRSRSPRRRSYSRSRSRGGRYERNDRHRSPPRYRERHRSRSRSPYGDRRGGDYRRRRSSPRRPRATLPSGDRDRPPAPPSTVLGCFGLSMYTRERDLEDLFAEFGRVENVVIIKDRATGRSKKFGFITMENIDDAEAAKNKLNGIELQERHIRVDFSHTPKAHNPTPGMYVGTVEARERDEARSRYGNDRRDYDRRDYDRRDYDRRDQDYDRRRDD